MAQKLLKAGGKRKIAAKKAVTAEARRNVLVGTYAVRQLEKWPGYYNYPLYGKDRIDVEAVKGVNELWLFSGAKLPRYFAAECLGVKTREELKEFGYKPSGKGHGSGKYLLFKIKKLYAPSRDFAESVTIRTKDFAGQGATQKQLKQYLESPDRKDPLLANMLPKIVTELPRERLRVCEVAVQLDLFNSMPEMKFICACEDRVEMNSLPKCVYENVDAFEFMKGLPAGSVQLVLTSPPYNVGKEYEAKTSIEKYLEWIRPIVEQICRIVSDRGSVCWQVGNYVNEGEVFPLDIYFYEMFKDCGMHLRNRVIWHFGHGLHCKNRFSGRYETILWFSKTKDYVFNLDDVRIPSKYPGKRYYKGDKKGQLSGNPLGKNPEDVWTLQKVAEDWDELIWDIPNVKSNHPEKVDHPCQFPIELVERCILALTNKGDIVYDPFAGVGSTLIGALKNGRIGYGTELERKYIGIGKERVAALARGELKMRPITQEIFAANKAGSLSKIPAEWQTKGCGK